MLCMISVMIGFRSFYSKYTAFADICALPFLSSLVLNACGSPGHIENYFYNRPDYKGAFHSRELKNEIAIFAVKCRPGG